MRRNMILRNSVDTDTTVATYSSCVKNESSDQSRSRTKKVEDARRSVVQRSAQKVKNFGEASDNHGWIECTSKSIPGKTYYYNVRSYCRTWQRPLSRTVQLPKFSLKATNFETESTCNLSLAALSDEEEYKKNKRLREEPSTTRQSSSLTRDHVAEILSHLYYCPLIRSSGNHRPDNSSKAYNFLDINTNRNSVDSTSTIMDKSLPDETLSTNSVQSSVLLPTDFLQTQLNCLNNDSPPPTFPKERSLIISDKDWESDGSENNENKCQDYSRLRLKEITACDLTKNIDSEKNRARKRKKRKLPVRSSKAKKNNEPRKIICNAYGTRTINYDPVVPELPPGVRKSNLSDTSITTFATCLEKQTNETMADAFIDLDSKWNINAPVLSESASSCSCSFCTPTANTRSYVN